METEVQVLWKFWKISMKIMKIFVEIQRKIWRNLIEILKIFIEIMKNWWYFEEIFREFCKNFKEIRKK